MTLDDEKKTVKKKNPLSDSLENLDEQFKELDKILSGMHESVSTLSFLMPSAEPAEVEEEFSPPLKKDEEKASSSKNDLSFLDDVIVQAEKIKTERRKGSFRFENTEEGLFLVVEGEVEFDRLLKERDFRGFEVEDAVLLEAMRKGSGEPIRVADPQARPALDARYEVKISPDRVSAYLVIHPPRQGGLPPTARQAFKVLEEVGVSGASESAVQIAVENRQYSEEVLVAYGRPPRHGIDGQLVYDVVMPPPRSLEQAASSGRVDHREGGPIVMVKAGDRIVYRKPPIEGESGYAVTGEILPPRPPKDVPLVSGKNTRYDSYEDALFAECDGQVVFETNGARVEPIFHVKGDVDYSVGNIEFGGTVQIDGAILDEFRVKAGHDVIVNSIGKSYVEAGANVFVRAGIISRGGGLVAAGESVTARFIENATVRAGENIVVSEAVIHSDLSAGGHIVAGGKRGALVGGRARCGGDCWAKTLGAEAETHTTIMTGVDPQTRERLELVEKELQERQGIFDKSILGLRHLTHLEKLTEEQKDVMRRLKEVVTEIRASLQTLKKEVEELQKIVMDVKPSTVTAVETAFPGVKIEIQNDAVFLNRPASYTTFYLKDGKIELGPARSESPLQNAQNTRTPR